MSGIRIKALKRNDDIKQIADLFNVLYPHRPVKNDYVIWRYLDNPFTPSTYVIKDSDKIVGSYSSCVFEGFIGNKKAKIGLMYDLMIDLKYQNRGLVVPLYDALLKDLTNKKPDFVYCFANKRSSGLFIKRFGWEMVKKAPFYYNQTKRLKKLLEKKRLDVNQIEYKNFLNNDISTFTTKALKEAKIQTFITRSKKFLLWRTTKIFGKDFKLYVFYKDKKLIGLCVIKFFEDQTTNTTTADIMDAVAYPKKNLYPILYIICNIIEDLNIKNIATFGFGQTRNRDLKELGFEKSDINWNLVILNHKKSTKPKLFVSMLDAEMF